MRTRRLTGYQADYTVTNEMNSSADGDTTSRREIERLRQEIVDLRESVAAFRESQARTVLFLTELQALMEGDLGRLRRLALIMSLISNSLPGRAIRASLRAIRRMRQR
jgi:hypothetical protein